MTIKEFEEAIKDLGFDIKRGADHCYVVRGDDTFARISRWRIRYVDTYYNKMSKLDEKKGLAIMAVVFEFTNTPVDKREDGDYRVYSVYEESEFVGHKLYVAGYGKNGEKLALDANILTSISFSRNKAEEVAEQVGKITDHKFEIEEVDYDDQ